MKYYQLYFSPTGGTKKVADLICSSWNCHLEPIDLSSPTTDFSQYTMESDDVCLIALPSFGGRVPGIAADRLSQLHGGNAKAILVCVYGNRAYEDTLLEMKNILTASGFRCAAAVAAVAQHSVMPQFAAGRPDSQDRRELAEFGENIHEKLMRGEIRSDVQVPGNHPYREYRGIPLKPRAGKACNRCGLCAQKCPLQAIDPNNPRITDKGTCISCMQCITICPQHARSLNPFVLSVVGQLMKKNCSQRKENQLFL